MLSASSCHSCVWFQVPPLIFTFVAAATEELALSLSGAPHTPHIYLWHRTHRTSISMAWAKVGKCKALFTLSICDCDCVVIPWSFLPLGVNFTIVTHWNHHSTEVAIAEAHTLCELAQKAFFRKCRSAHDSSANFEFYSAHFEGQRRVQISTFLK